MMERTFRLTNDIQNPDYDGRCKHGLKAMKVFKSGSVVRAKPNRYDHLYTYSLARDEGGFEMVDLGPVHEEIVKQDPGVETPIQTLEEAAAQVHANITEFCRYVVRQLIKEGRLDPAETKELYEKTNENDW